MRIAFISDIHGNSPALEAVLDDIKTRNVDNIVVLGDLCFRGPDPKKSLRLVQSLHTDVIMGNADEWVIRGIRQGEVADQAFEIMTKEREWTKERLDGEDLKYLASLPRSVSMTVDGVKINCFHATPADLFEVVLPDASDDTFSEKMFLEEADIYFYGHIHKAFIRFIGGKTIVNLGSVGLPFDGHPKASYALLETENGTFQTSIVKVPYDVEKVIEQLIESDYPNKEFLSRLLRTAMN